MATGLFVSGEWIDGAASIEVRNKFSGASIRSVAVAGPKEIELAMASAVRGAATMAKLPAHRRAEILAATSRGITERRESLAKLIAERKLGSRFERREQRLIELRTRFLVAAEEAKRIHGETLPLDASPSGEGYFGFWWRKPVWCCWSDHAV